jgi:tetratricopeptide (TPR) repeat protein
MGAALGGCAVILPQSTSLRDQPPADLPPKAELREVPFHAQDDYQCGPAALAMALNAAGVFATPEELVDQVYLPGRKGSLQIEMLVAARRHGLVAYELAPRLEDVLREVAAGTPVVVLENYGFRIWPKWHYSVVVGYDLQAGEIIRRSGMFPRQTMPFLVFEYVWKDDGRWAMVAVPPGRVPATATEERYAGAVVALEKSGQPAVARTAYEAMLKRWPSSLAGLMGLGNTAYALKDPVTAEAAFRRAVEAHPDSVAALNNLANVLAERGRLGEARAMAERAVGLGGPLQSAAQATLEEIRRKTGATMP